MKKSFITSGPALCPNTEENIQTINNWELPKETSSRADI